MAINAKLANLVLAGLVVATAVVAYLTVGSSSQTATAATRTSEVVRGSVLSSVSASGNVQAAQQFSVDFSSSGTVTRILVEQGERVRPGQPLARIDAGAAAAAVRTAEAQLASAEASLQQTLEGLTPQEVRQSDLAVTQAHAQVKSTEKGVAATIASNRSSLASLNAAVAQARTGLVQSEALARQNASTLAAAVQQARESLAQTRTSIAVNEQSLQTAIGQAAKALEDARTSASVSAASARGSLDQSNLQLQLDQTHYNLDVGTLNGIFGETPGAKASREAAQSAVNNDNAQIQEIREFQAANTAPYPGGFDALALQRLQYRLAQDQAVVSALTAITNDEVTLAKDAQAIAAARRALDANPVASQQSVTNATSAIENAKQNLAKAKVSNEQSLGSAEGSVRSALANHASSTLKDAQSIASAKSQLDNARMKLEAGKLENERALDGAKEAVANALASLANTLAANAVKASPANAAVVAQGRASVASARASLENARRTLREATLVAPAAGFVVSVDGAVGQSSSGSAAAGSGSTASASAASSGFISMIGAGTLQVKAGFGESDAAKVEIGQPATLTVSALPNVTLAAHVIQIDTVSTVVSNVVTYFVTLQLERVTPELKPGMTVTTQVIADKRDGVLHVPTAAVTGSGSSGTVAVVGATGVRSTRTIGVGLKGDDSTEITSGLKAGEQVVITTALAAASSTTGGFTGGRFPGGGGLGRGLGG